MEKIRGDINVQSGAGQSDTGEIFVYQRFFLPAIPGHDEKVVFAGWSVPDFEGYLAESYRLLKDIKLKIAQEEKRIADEQAQKERSDTGTLSSEGSEAKPDEPSCDRGCELSEASQVGEGCSLDAPNSTDSNQ